MSTHTPGPWREYAPEISGVVSENYRTVTGGEESERFGAPEDQWGGAAHFCLTGYLSPSNARLIAAAPDLLALARQYASECGDCHGTGIEIPSGADCPHCADIRAVIAKVEGR